MNFLTIPDIHGRDFWKDPVNKYINTVDKIIFTGDYFDPYPEDKIKSFDSMVDNFNEIISIKAQSPDKVILLYGNHDYHYANQTFDSLTRSTRYDSHHANQLRKLFDDNKSFFQICYQINNTMFSHAGVTKFWIDTVNIIQDNNLSDNINKLKDSDDGAHQLAIIGYRRTWLGDKTGSPLWCDLLEFVNDEGLGNNIFQVFGHTRLKEGKYYKTDTFACIDCQRCFIVDDKHNIEMIEK